MKSRDEAEKIKKMLESIVDSFHAVGERITLVYDSFADMVNVVYDDEVHVISIYGDSPAAAVRNVVRGLARVM